MSSKCLASKAKPSSNSSRLIRITHSCNRCAPKPLQPGPVANGEKKILYSAIVSAPPAAIGNVWW